MLGYFLADYIRSKLSGSIVGKLGRAAVKHPDIAGKCALAGAGAAPFSLLDAPQDMARLARLKKTEGTEFLLINGKLSEEMGVSPRDLSVDFQKTYANGLERAVLLPQSADRQMACAAGTLTGTVAGGVGTGLAVSFLTGGIGTAAISFRAASSTAAAYSAAALTVQGSNAALTADTVIQMAVPAETAKKFDF